MFCKPVVLCLFLLVASAFAGDDDSVEHETREKRRELISCEPQMTSQLYMSFIVSRLA